MFFVVKGKVCETNDASVTGVVNVRVETVVSDVVEVVVVILVNNGIIVVVTVVDGIVINGIVVGRTVVIVKAVDVLATVAKLAIVICGAVVLITQVE